jgi:hypothetical protein
MICRQRYNIKTKGGAFFNAFRGTKSCGYTVFSLLTKRKSIGNDYFCTCTPEKGKRMEKDTKNKIEFMVVCISEFARRYKLTLQQAFRYLNNWKGLAFLEEFYDVEHLLSIEDAVDDLTVVCKKNGGMLA